MRKVKAVYRRCRQLGINALLITEHSYKSPRRAFDYMRSALPKGFYLFPGLEYITRDQIDIIVFSRSEEIYDYPELTSFTLSFEELVAFVNKKDELEAFVTHPFTLGGTGIVKRKGISFARAMVEKLGAVEVSYDVFAPLRRVVETKNWTRSLFKKFLYKVSLNENFPVEFYPRRCKFFAVGSDAHHVKQIGTCCELEVDCCEPEAVFAAILNNRFPRVVLGEKQGSYWFMRAGMTAAKEYILKQKMRAGGGIKKRLTRAVKHVRSGVFQKNKTSSDSR